MRSFVLLLLLSVTSFAYGQNLPVLPNHTHSKNPAVFLDSVQVSSMIMGFIKPEEIVDISVNKDYVDHANNLTGAIYITSKNQKSYNFIDIEGIKKLYKIETADPILYMLENEFIQDTKFFTLPSLWIYNVIVLKGSSFDTLKDNLPNLTIVKILTTKEHKAGIFIRGLDSKVFENRLR